MNTSALVQKLWNYCNGPGLGRSLARSPYRQPSRIPAAYAWPALLAKDGDALFDLYRHTPDELGKTHHWRSTAIRFSPRQWST